MKKRKSNWVLMISLTVIKVILAGCDRDKDPIIRLKKD
jgi:hypothetical protein